MSKIDKLTPEQERIAKEYIAKYHEIAGTTGRCDREKALAAFQAFYDFKGYGKIKDIIWFDNLLDAARFTAKGIKARRGIDPTQPEQRAEIEAIEVSRDEVRDMLQKACYGSYEAYWVGFYIFCRDVLKTENHPLIDISDAIAKNTGVAWFCQDYVVASERPISQNRNGVQFESIGDNPAVLFPDGTAIYARNGKRYNTLIEMKMAEKGLL